MMSLIIEKTLNYNSHSTYAAFFFSNLKKYLAGERKCSSEEGIKKKYIKNCHIARPGLK